MTYKPPEYRFLVDVNLPKFFKYFTGEQFIHIVDLNPSMTDEEIWKYAINNNLIILTKDTDFYHRFMSTKNCPKVIYFKLGNMTLKEMHYFFQNN